MRIVRSRIAWQIGAGFAAALLMLVLVVRGGDRADAAHAREERRHRGERPVIGEGADIEYQIVGEEMAYAATSLAATSATSTIPIRPSSDHQGLRFHHRPGCRPSASAGADDHVQRAQVRDAQKFLDAETALVDKKQQPKALAHLLDGQPASIGSARPPPPSLPTRRRSSTKPLPRSGAARMLRSRPCSASASWRCHLWRNRALHRAAHLATVDGRFGDRRRQSRTTPRADRIVPGARRGRPGRDVRAERTTDRGLRPDELAVVGSRYNELTVGLGEISREFSLMTGRLRDVLGRIDGASAELIATGEP